MVRGLTATKSRVLWDSGSTAIASAIGQAPALVGPLSAVLLGASASSDRVFLALAVAAFVTTTLSGATQFAVVPFLVTARAGGDGGGVFLTRLTQLVICASALLSVTAAWIVPAYYPRTRHGLPVVLGPFQRPCRRHRAVRGGAQCSHSILGCCCLAVVEMADRLGLPCCAESLTRSGEPDLGYSLGEAIRLLVMTRSVAAQYPKAAALPRTALWSRELQHFSRSAAAQIAASGALAFVPIVDRIMASELPRYNVLLRYTDRIWQVPVSFAMSGLLVVVLSKWSHDLHGTGRGSDVFSQTRRTATDLCLAAVVPCAIAIWLRGPIAALLFAHGRFPTSAVPVVADTLGAYVLGIPTYLAGLAPFAAYSRRSGPDGLWSSPSASWRSNFC